MCPMVTSRIYVRYTNGLFLRWLPASVLRHRENSGKPLRLPRACRPRHLSALHHRMKLAGAPPSTWIDSCCQGLYPTSCRSPSFLPARMRAWGLKKTPEVAYPMQICPCRQGTVVTADSGTVPAGYAAEQGADGLKRCIGSTHQALAEIVEAVPHMPEHAFVVVARLQPQGRVVISVYGPLHFKKDPVS